MSDELELEDIGMTQARNDLMARTSYWMREGELNLPAMVYLLKDILNYYEYQNREDAEFDEDWRIEV